MSSEKFRNYSPSTRDGWGRELLLAELPQTLGALSTHTIRPALVMAFLDGYAGRPGKQRAALAALKQVERWAIVRDLLQHPITTGVQVEPSTDGHIPWNDDQVELAERNARVELARAITLAANTGQRGSDIVRMRWGDIEDFRGRPGIHVKQKKTGRKLWVPFTQALMTAMMSWEKRPGFLITGPSGKPWTRMALTKAWIAERRDNPALKPLKIAGLVMHGLRATAVVRLSRFGANSRQIADLVGMSEKMVARYCRHSSQQENASAAILHLEEHRSERDRNEALR